MKSSEGGFTLLESMFVLSVFLIIASFSAFLLKPQFLFLERQQFISQLKADILFAQNYAISHQTEVILQIRPEVNSYYMKERSKDNLILNRQIPDSITFREGTMSLYIQFLADGNVTKFGTFYVISGKKSYRFTFLIGKGRFYVEEE